MKDREIKKAVKSAYNISVDRDKKAHTIGTVLHFGVNTLRARRSIGIYQILYCTFGHISAGFWIVSLLAFFFLGFAGSGQTAVVICAPILAAAGFDEWSKSFNYGMWELEKTCRLDLRRMLLIKFFITGTGSMAALIAANMIAQGNIPKLNNTLSSLAAFNISCLICFVLSDIVRKVNSRIVIFTGAAFAAALMGSLVLTLGDKLFISYLGSWITALAASYIALLLIIIKTFRREEII